MSDIVRKFITSRGVINSLAKNDWVDLFFTWAVLSGSDENFEELLAVLENAGIPAKENFNKVKSELILDLVSYYFQSHSSDEFVSMYDFYNGLKSNMNISKDEFFDAFKKVAAQYKFIKFKTTDMWRFVGKDYDQYVSQ